MTTRSKKKATKKTASKKKSVTEKAVALKVASKKTSKLEKSTQVPITISPEERWKMIAVVAYHKAEQRGFAPGRENDDWSVAEQEVEKLLGS